MAAESNDPLLKAQQLIKKGLDPSLLTLTQEKLAPTGTRQRQLKIGIPRESSYQETRVPLTPGAVSTLVANGHRVLLEHDAGALAQYTDTAFSEAGGQIAYSKEEVFKEAEILIKIAPLSLAEIELLKPGQTIISAVHIGGIRPDYLKGLMRKGVTAVGFEFLQAPDGSVPIMRMMSEIAGITSIHIATELLAAGPSGGKGLLLGGVTGVPPSVVTIIGAGAVGYHACKAALGLGATVKVIDTEVYKLKRLEELLGHKIYTAVAQPNYVAEAVATSDVLIGAAYRHGARAPVVVTEDMVAQMKAGSVIVDVAIDQGGCIETSRITTHEHPTFELHGVVHYCVPNIAARVAHTASASISNILGPLLLRIADAGGVKNLMATDPFFKRGIYAYHKHLTHRMLAAMFGLDFMDIELLYAAEL